MPNDVTELIVALKSSTFSSLTGLSAAQIGVLITFVVAALMPSWMQLPMQFTFPALMQLIAVINTCSSSSPLGLERASATTLALPRRYLMSVVNSAMLESWYVCRAVCGSDFLESAGISD